MKPPPLYELPIYWFPVYNQESETCPPGAAVEIKSISASTGIASIGKPATSSSTAIFFNGPTAIPALGTGQATQTVPAIAAYQADNTDCTDPTHGEAWGVRASSWYLHNDQTGFLAIGAGGYGLVNVIRADTSSSSTQFITGVLASGATTGYIRTIPGLEGSGSTAGNTRGAGAVDFQMLRASATQIASGPYSMLIGGYGLNTASGDYAVVIGGNGNVVSGNNSFIIGSVLSTITNHNSVIIGGRFSTSSNFSTFIGGGESCETNADYSAAFGLNAKSTLDGQISQANGRFAANGDAQTSVLCAKISTTNSSVTDLLLENANLFTIPTDTTWAFSALIVARRTDADNESAAYQLLGCIDNNAGTVALVGTVTKTVIAEDSSAWDATAVAGATNLIFQVTGQAGKTIYWVARVELTQVTG